MDSFVKTIEKVRRTINKYHMISPGRRIVIALSGGPDSVCLLDILYQLQSKLNINLLVAHFDHGLRPEDDESETEFAMSLAKKYDLPFETEKAYASIESMKGSLEEIARISRYRFLEDVMAKVKAGAVALGHNMNDQAETVLMRLMRGSGSSGLAGIPPKRQGTFIRPLIEITREEIEDYIHHKGLNYVTDPSNLDTTHLRNRVRQNLLPLLIKDYQPRVVEILAKTAEIVRLDDEFLRSQAYNWLKQKSKIHEGSRVGIPLPSFLGLEEALKRRIIKEAIEITGGLRRVGNTHIEAVCRLAAGSKSQSGVDLPNNLQARKVYDRLLIETNEEELPVDYDYILDGPGRFVLKDAGGIISLEELEVEGEMELRGSRFIAHLDRDLLEYPLHVRNFRPGDKFIPLGMRGHRKVKDFFIDLKIPFKERANTPILTFRDRPVWLCGFRIDERFKVSSRTKRVLRARWE